MGTLNALGYAMIAMTAVFIFMAVRKILPRGLRGFICLLAVPAVACGLAFAAVVAPATTAPGTLPRPPHAAGASFTDTFTGPAGAPVQPWWVHQVGDSQKFYASHDLEAYSAATEYSHLDGNGHLIMKAVKDAEGDWTSSRLSTEGTFAQYRGTFSARILFPNVRGMWPAFWILGPDHREVDVAELYGNGKWMDNSTVHGPGQPRQLDHRLPDTAPGWHTYSVGWNRNGFKFSEDGKLYAIIPARHGWGYEDGTKMNLVLTMAVGGGPGGKPATSTSSIDMEVDWVNVTAR